MVRRLRYWYLFVEDEVVVDLEKLKFGDVFAKRIPALSVFVAITGAVHEISLGHLEILLSVPEREWIPVTSLGEEGQQALEALGLLGLVELSDRAHLPLDQDASDTEFDLGLYESVESGGWNNLALFFHRWNQRCEDQISANAAPSEIEKMRAAAAANAEAFIERYGAPPNPFYHREDSLGEEIKLSEELGDGQLYEILRQRRTSRYFDREASVGLEKFSRILKYSFGGWGVCRYSERFWTVHKTSPSGGGLHPIEAYPIVRNVSGVPPGIYHYDVAHHSLVPLKLLQPTELAESVIRFSQNQTFVGGAQFLVVLVARFPRNFWKYRERQNSYLVVMKDAGHLNQTFSLLAAAEGLGAFYTGALAPSLISDALGLESINESPVGICGCGVIGLGEDPGRLPLSFDRET